MSRTRPNSWPPRPVPRTLPPWDRVPERDVMALVAHYAPIIATWPAHDRWRLREVIILAMMEVMRDCDDARIRADAFNVLVKMGVFPRC